MEMSMAQWAKYFENPEREKLLNVISLEFSRTRLDDYVSSPNLVREVDWVDNVWPPHLKDTQTEATNAIADMKYPKVQKYCLMSVAGCYTDFHIDFGGTSVWYHVLHGQKVFWLIPPTDHNLQLYEAWVLSGKQGDIFLGDRVKDCARITLHDGYTFMIPTGWIHAVYTPVDSLVFGGNFLHGFNIPEQLRVSDIEDRTKVPQKFRYPFFNEMLWYVLDRYVTVLMGKSRVQIPEERSKSVVGENANDGDKVKSEKMEPDEKSTDKTREEGGASSPVVSSSGRTPRLRSKSSSVESAEDKTADKDKRKTRSEDPKKAGDAANGSPSKEEGKGENGVEKKERVHLTKDELTGLETIVNRLGSMPAHKRHVPEGLTDPEGLLEDTKQLLKDHANDDPELAATGKQILEWPQSMIRMRQRPKYTPGKVGPKAVKAGGTVRRRRTRCRKCENCCRDDCGKCTFCRDMKKYGGPGRMKQSCLQRQCLAPVLPHTACCSICGGDDHEERVKENGIIALMECHVCFEVVHPECCKGEGITEKGVINEDLANSWECPKCVGKGHNSDEEEPVPKPARVLPGKQMRGRKRKDLSPEKQSSPLRKKMLKPGAGRGRGGMSANRIPGRSPGKRPREKEDDGRRRKMFKKRKGILGRPRLKGPIGRPKGVRPNTLTRAYKIKKEKLLAKQRLLKKKIQEMKINRQKSQGLLHGAGAQLNHELMSEPSTSLQMSKDSSLNNSANGMRRSPRTVGGGRTHKLPIIVPVKPVEMERHVVRPRPISPPPESFLLDTGSDHVMKREVWMSVFKYLSQQDLCRCLLVCKTWNRWCCDKRLWRKINLTRMTPISPLAMSGIIRRQPVSLDLGHTNISKKQLSWVVNRLPGLKELGLSGCSWAAVSALCTVSCPLLKSLDLRWVEGIRDHTVKDLLSPPADHRPGSLDEQSRLRCLVQLLLTGCDVTDAAMKWIVMYCPMITHLDLSYCTLLTDAAIHTLTSNESPIRHKLKELDVTGCWKLTDQSLEHLQHCPQLSRVRVKGCTGISKEAWERLNVYRRQHHILMDPRVSPLK